MRSIERYISPECSFYARMLVQLRDGQDRGLTEDMVIDAGFRHYISDYFPELIGAYEDHQKAKQDAFKTVREWEDGLLAKLRQNQHAEAAA